jgi:Zn-dependent protease with chaperone function
MDFFARQAATRRQSRWMVFLFILAVVAIVIAIDFVVVVTVAILSVQDDGGLLVSPDMSVWRYPTIILFTSLFVLGTIGISSVARTVSLAAGGSRVAEQLGGTRVGADTADPLKRRLRNVVEEIAIASGVPVPQVYVLEREAGINAFAAGYSAANAAIAVTRGALVNLDRDELQGVIAHEFSHVLNGDMRLSTRLIGLLFGLTVIAMIARTILRVMPRGGDSGRKSGGGLGVIIVAALIVLALGWIGLFFGRLIQAAVSRNRESLADASAVQFTRDPTGLRNALVKIGALGAGSRFSDADAEEVAHMLFAPGIRRAFATHPPLERPGPRSWWRGRPARRPGRLVPEGCCRARWCSRRWPWRSWSPTRARSTCSRRRRCSPRCRSPFAARRASRSRRRRCSWRSGSTSRRKRASASFRSSARNTATNSSNRS